MRAQAGLSDAGGVVASLASACHSPLRSIVSRANAALPSATLTSTTRRMSLSSRTVMSWLRFA